MVVSGSFDETVRLWDVRKGLCHRTIAAHSEAVTNVDFNRDGTLIASCSYDGLIRLWDVPTGLCLATLPQPSSTPTTSIRFTPSSSHLLASSLDSTLRLWDVVNGKVVKTYRAAGAETDGASRLADQDGIAVKSGDAQQESSREVAGGVIGGFQNERFAIKSNFVIRKHPGAAGSSRHNGTHEAANSIYVVSGSEDCKIYLWELQSRRTAAVLAGHHRDVVGAVAVHPTAQVLASAALDHDLSIKVYMDGGLSEGGGGGGGINAEAQFANGEGQSEGEGQRHGDDEGQGEGEGEAEAMMVDEPPDAEQQ